MRTHIYNKVDEERMRQLLDRFMQGATTLDEEQWLADQLRDCNRKTSEGQAIGSLVETDSRRRDIGGRCRDRVGDCN